jgi:hypothetical protein
MSLMGRGQKANTDPECHESEENGELLCLQQDPQPPAMPAITRAIEMTMLRAIAVQLFISVTLLVQLSAPAHATNSGFGDLTPAITRLSQSSIARLIAVIPELAEKTSSQQLQLMSAMAGPAQSTMSESELEALNAIYSKHGFTLEEFAMQISALMATYFVVDPTAFERMMPSEKNPLVKLMLEDPSQSAVQKQALRKQIDYVAQNKALFMEQFRSTTDGQNQKLVKTMLPKIRAALNRAQKIALDGAKKGKK